MCKFRVQNVADKFTKFAKNLMAPAFLNSVDPLTGTLSRLPLHDQMTLTVTQYDGISPEPAI